MSDIEKLFLTAYPLWPKVLLKKFSNLLSYEVAKFNPEINFEIMKQFLTLADEKRKSIIPDIFNNVSLYNFGNNQFSKYEYFEKILMRIDYAEILAPYMDSAIRLYTNMVFSGKCAYDFRLFSNISIRTDVEYTKSNIGYDPVSHFEIYKTEIITPIVSKPVLVIIPSLRPYDGASTVLAMIENGISIDVNQKSLTEFVTFLNAYNKYGGELAAANSLQAEKNRQAMADYKNSISEKLNSRKNELNDLRTQISFAAKNETASAKRDMQNLTLSAQSLMLQLQDKLK